jgi:hypothetical protein
MLSLKVLFKGLYKVCECGEQNCFISVINTRGKPARFKQGHNLGNGENSPSWRGGRSIDGHGYWRINLSEFNNSNKDSRIKEHVYFYEQFHKLCMLPWGVIHHIDRNKENNEISNLQGMMKRDHARLHAKGNKNTLDKHIDTSDRICFVCKSKTTRISKPDKRNKTPGPVWRHLPWDKINWYCDNCAAKDLYKWKKKIRT